MATLYIREYADMGVTPIGESVPCGIEPAIVGQTVSFTTSTQSSAFNVRTHFVRLIADADAYVDFGTNPTATTGDGLKLEADVAEYFAVKQINGLKLAVYDGTS